MQYKRLIPNLLTASRFLAVPVFVILMIKPTHQSQLWACALFIIASFTDWLDGYLARLYDAQTILGKILDPLADKIIVTAALVMLVAKPDEPRVPAWMAVVLLSREIIVTGLRSLAAIKNTVVPASRAAKYKTAWTMIAVVLLLIDETYNLGPFVVDFFKMGMLILWVALIFSVMTGIAYGVELRDTFRELGRVDN